MDERDFQAMNKDAQGDIKPLKKRIAEQMHYAADNWVFQKNGHKWSNNDDTAGDKYGSFIAGAKWALEIIKKIKLH